MGRKNSSGFTLLEMTVALSLAVVLSLLTFTVFGNMTRVVNQDTSILRMDTAADNTLSAVTAVLRTAILPIITDSESDDFRKKLNSPIHGFGNHGEDWRNLLRMETNVIAFSIPADFGGDRDYLDADMMAELGIILPDGTHVPTGQYSSMTTNHLTGSLNPFLAALNPTSDLSIQSTRSSLNLSATRFDGVSPALLKFEKALPYEVTGGELHRIFLPA